MCRRTHRVCSEFGPPEAWSLDAPLRPPAWFWDEVAAFAAAAHTASRGDRAQARAQFAALRADDARAWYVEHGQNSSGHRLRVRHIPEAPRGGRADRDVPPPIQAVVAGRDTCTCQYCGLPTIRADAFDALAAVVGTDVLPWGKTNAARHGIALVAWTQFDHVVPNARGGPTTPDNLVVACASCNFGKAGATLEELGLHHPRRRQLTTPGWDGLAGLIPALRRLAPSSPTRRRRR